MWKGGYVLHPASTEEVHIIRFRDSPEYRNGTKHAHIFYFLQRDVIILSILGGISHIKSKHASKLYINVVPFSYESFRNKMYEWNANRKSAIA